MSHITLPPSAFPNCSIPDAGVIHSWLSKTLIGTRVTDVSAGESEATVTFAGEPSDDDRAFVFELCMHGGHAGLSADRDGRVRVSSEPRSEGAGRVIVTHRWNDRTTWYTQSNRVTGHSMTDSGDGLTFDSGIPYWIDMIHGKVYRENMLAPLYVETVYVDGSAKSYGTDYTVDYVGGSVTFAQAQTGVVTADFSHESGSLFVVAPSSGKKRLWIEYSEVQFSEDVDINSTTHFQAWAYDPMDLPNKIAVAPPTSYYNLDNYIEEANGTYPVIPPMGGTRGFTSPRHTFPFNYPTLKDLHACQGVEIRLWIEGDVPFGGEYGTVTFYCTEYDTCKEHPTAG